jgi:ribosomal protein S18 acetylase RimI-like enzyme
VVRAEGDLARQAMMRLMGGDSGVEPGDDASRGWEDGRPGLLEDLALGQASRLWVSVLQDGTVGEAAQVVPSSGRTAGVYLAPGTTSGVTGRFVHQQRVAVINAACEALAAGEYGEAVLAQGLLEPGEFDAAGAYLDAGFVKLAELGYLRREVSRFARYERPVWPAGVRVTRMSELPWDTGQSLLVRAMEASYIGTLDCPSLCGMRTVEDVLASHKSVGTFDPALWWLATLDGTPAGCMLLSRFPAHDTVELVYLGVSPVLRGKGVAAGLLDLALHELQTLGERSMACAVDMNNKPALALYKRCRFKEFARRSALIRDLRGRGAGV